MFGLNVKNELLDRVAEFCYQNNINYEYWPKQESNSMTLLNFETIESRNLISEEIHGNR